MNYEITIFGQRFEKHEWDEVEKAIREVFSTEAQLKRAFGGRQICIRKVEDVTEDSKIHFLPLSNGGKKFALSF